MEQVAAVVDAETYRKLKGFRCHISNCGRFIPGYVDELKIHFRDKHSLNTSHVAEIPFVCSEFGSFYKRFKHLKRHIVAFHPRGNVLIQPEEERPLPDQPGTIQFNDTLLNLENEPNYSGVKNKFFQPVISISDVTQLAETFVMKMRCDVGLPETKIKEFIQATEDLLEQSGRYYLGIFKSFLRKRSVAFDDVDVVNAINKFEIPNIFVNACQELQDILCLLQGKNFWGEPESLR